MNVVTLVGNAATDVTVRETSTGKKVADFRIAINRYGSDEADFFTVKLWDRQAETAVDMIHKGRRVAITGRLNTESWVAANGENRSRIVVVASNYQVYGPRMDGQEQEATADSNAVLAVF